jgi:hypothetical protein
MTDIYTDGVPSDSSRSQGPPLSCSRDRTPRGYPSAALLAVGGVGVLGAR